MGLLSRSVVARPSGKQIGRYHSREHGYCNACQGSQEIDLGKIAITLYLLEPRNALCGEDKSDCRLLTLQGQGKHNQPLKNSNPLTRMNLAEIGPFAIVARRVKDF